MSNYRKGHIMRDNRCFRIFVLTIPVLLLALTLPGIGQIRRYPKTPLPQDILTLLTGEISGQVIFNNEVLLAGAPWMRDKKEFSDTLYESQKIFDLVRGYGITTTRLDRYPSERKFTYPFEGEFWLLKPHKRLVARLDADPALIASGSASVDVSGELIYIPLLTVTDKELEEWIETGMREKYRGKIALMWSHPRGNLAKALDAAGLAGVVSFNTRERYFDPDQVVYSRGPYAEMTNLKFGFSVSWRQWSELLEDVERGQKLTVRCKTRLEEFQDKFETVFSWIPGTEPDEKGIIFTAHLFEGYTKRGANDNMSGCVIQLEILRALSKLIHDGDLPQPRRSIYFLWPNEISGTYEQFKRNPGLIDKLSSNINMDMCGEWLRKNNSWFTMSECPNHLPCYLDGLADSVMNYVWRTNDIVYLRDVPPGRPGGQYFPLPMWEKNGSKDAFRYFIHSATGGSDHICFNNPSVGVPGIEFFTWPDQWYHADTDTPDKSDPTQMKRVAFIGASMAWAAANCQDAVLEDMLDAVNTFGYQRIGKRELPQALSFLEKAEAPELQKATSRALNLVSFAVEREIGALRSLDDLDDDSPQARAAIDQRIRQWVFYLDGLNDQILRYGRLKAAKLNTAAPKMPRLSSEEKKFDRIVPKLHVDVKHMDFGWERSDRFTAHLKEHPDAVKELKINRTLQRSIQNFINGERSITKIRNCVIAETGMELSFAQLTGYLDLLKKLDWVTL